MVDKAATGIEKGTPLGDAQPIVCTRMLILCLMRMTLSMKTHTSEFRRASPVSRLLRDHLCAWPGPACQGLTPPA